MTGASTIPETIAQRISAPVPFSYLKWRILLCLSPMWPFYSLRASSPGRSDGGAGKGKESLQLRLWKLNSTSNSPVAGRRLSCKISANQRKGETSANVNKHWKTRAKGNDVISNVISANQYFAPTFSMQIFKIQGRSFPPERPGELARRLPFCCCHFIFFRRFSLFVFYVLASNFRPRDVLQEIFLFSFHIHMNVHPRA